MGIASTVSNIAQKVKKAAFETEQTLSTFRRVVDEHLVLLEQVKKSELTNTEFNRKRVKHALDETAKVFKTINNVGVKNFPDRFWKTDEGQLMAYGYEWLMGDDLISIKEAMSILRDVPAADYTYNGSLRGYMNTLTCGRYADAPLLETYWIMNARYPKRVSKERVLALKQKRGAK